MFGLSFANPSILYGLWAALLPLVIHLFNRRRSVTMSFSNVALLQALQHDRMRQVKLKQILLLILRTLLIVLLVLAFARPTATGASGSRGAGDSATSAVILLDQSLSMRYRTSEGSLFERGKNRVREILSMFQAQDEVQVILVDNEATALTPSSLSSLKARIDNGSPKFGLARMALPLQAARAHLHASQLPNRELYVVSDFARSGWSAVEDTTDWGGVSVFLVRERLDPVQNARVATVKAVGGLIRVGQPVTLEVELANDGDAREVAVQAFLDGRRIVQQVAHLSANSQKKIYAAFTPESVGAHEVRVEIGEDALPEDNTRISVVQVPDRVRILVVAPSDQESYFLIQALDAAAFSVVSVSPEAVTDEALADVNVVFLCGVSHMSPPVIERLRKHVSAGAGLGIILGEQVDQRHYNDRILPALLPATLMSVRGQPGVKTAYQALPQELPDHPLLAEIRVAGSFTSPRFFAHFVVRPEGNTQTVFSFTNGAPALLDAPLGQGHVALFVSGWHANMTWNDMPVSGFFLPFVYRLTGYLVAGATNQSDYPVGAVVSRLARVDGEREGVLRPPGKEALTLWPQQRGVQKIWPVGPVDAPGLWEVYAGEQRVDRFAVQLDPAASDLEPASETAVGATFQNAAAYWLSSDQPVKDLVLPLRHGREFWRLALAAALAVMFFEMWLAKTTRTSRQKVS
jgi:hypothetical protein